MLTRAYKMLSYAIVIVGVAVFWFAIGAGVESKLHRSTYHATPQRRKLTLYASVIGILGATLYLGLVLQAMSTGAFGGLFAISQLFWSLLLLAFFAGGIWSYTKKRRIPGE